MADYDELRAVAADALTRAQAQLARDISGYPTPISGCDAQFNHMLAERRRLADAIAALSETVFVPTPRMPAPANRVESR